MSERQHPTRSEREYDALLVAAALTAGRRGTHTRGRLPRHTSEVYQITARVLRMRGWSMLAIAKALSVGRVAVRVWLRPEVRERRRAQAHEYTGTLAVAKPDPTPSDGSEVSAARGSEDGLEHPVGISGHAGSTTRAASRRCSECKGAKYMDYGMADAWLQEIYDPCDTCKGEGVVRSDDGH